MPKVITQKQINDQLSQEDNGDIGMKLIADWKPKLARSRSVMRKFFPRWNRQAMVYRGERWADEDDKKAKERDEPTKFVVPIAYAQVETLVSFLFMLFTQRDKMFELKPTGEEDYWRSKAGERFLQRDLDHNNFELVLHQFLKNFARYGMGILKHCWVVNKEVVMTSQAVPQIGLMSGAPIGMDTSQVETEVVTYEGNKIISISPYKFLPRPDIAY